jgi:Domain of unknown function (DUF2017)
MKLVRKEKDDFVFDIGKREKRLLLEVLKLYPLIPTAHHRANKTAGANPIAENLLEESLAESKRENKRQLRAMLNDEQRFKETDRGCHFTLSASQMEWLLQVVNDIRVGSWIILGQPDEKKGKPVELKNENARYYAAMEFCGYFQMTLLDAFAREP